MSGIAIFIWSIVAYMVIGSFAYQIALKYFKPHPDFKWFCDEGDCAAFGCLWLPLLVIWTTGLILRSLYILTTYPFTYISNNIDKVISKYRERSLTPLNEVSGRVISNIKERTQPW